MHYLSLTWLKYSILKDNVMLNLQGIESLIMLPRGADFPGCEDEDKEYFVSAGSKGNPICIFQL